MTFKRHFWVQIRKVTDFKNQKVSFSQMLNDQLYEIVYQAIPESIFSLWFEIRTLVPLLMTFLFNEGLKVKDHNNKITVRNSHQ
jgi:hypothetical protein